MPEDAIRIAHISDLHFGAKGYEGVSQSLAEHLRLRIKPHLVLVTGDLVDTPRESLFEEVYEWLEGLSKGLGWRPGEPPRYLVCPGNHDRHKSGNALPWRRARRHFETRFSEHKSSNPFSHWLGDEPHRWKVRVVSVDTSVRARFSAQAFLAEEDLMPIRNLKEWNDFEEPPYLVLMLFHHHLLPLPSTEAEAQSILDLFKFTSAVNPGKILENLAASYVDVVLHGHEHKRNIARYGSYRRNSNQIVVAGAASATGAETLRGCNSGRASFNLLELRNDRSVWIKEIRGPSGDHNDWHSALPIQVLDSTSLRHNRFLRSLYQFRKKRKDGSEALADEGHQSEWHKHITFTAGRDAVVREYRTDWLITDGEFSFRIQNDTGQPARPFAKGELVSAAGEPKLIGFSPLRGERGAYVFRVATGTSEPVAAAWIKTSYQWLDGILLTEDDLELIDMNHAGPFRANRQEFVAASVINPVRELNLSVTFPVGFYPDEKNVEVYYQKLPSGAPIEDGALRARLQFTGQTILFNLPYPLMGYRYAIAWKPVAARPLSKRAKAFQGRCLANGVGDSLASSFLRGLEGEWSGLCSVALYVPEPECSTPGRFLRRAGYTTGSMARSREGPETPPMQIDLRTRRGLYLHSWWGSTGIAVGDPGEFEERALSEGMLAGEFVTAIMPFSGDGDGDGFAPPWGIVRVGIMAPVPEVTQDVELFRSALARGYVEMLHAVL